ncbi:MAG: putative glycoside hydrolase [Longimicrobiales bacterium]|nr:putative glycoside hydrolase [Longimicrobiales bacterium]
MPWSRSPRRAPSFPTALRGPLGRNGSRGAPRRALADSARRALPGILLGLALLAACNSSAVLGTDDEQIPTSLDIVSSSLPESGELFVGESAVLVAELRDKRGRIINDSSIKWSSSAPDVAPIDRHGEIFGASLGAATITASHRHLTATLDVEIVGVASLEVSPVSAQLGVGESLELTVSAMTTGGDPLDPTRLQWSSSDPGVASVESGLVRGHAVGTTVIAAEAGELRAESAIEVTAASDDDGVTQSGRTVNFFVRASSGFDEWTSSPTLEEQEWMREHYFRMLTYSPYFDSRLSWYPTAWVYKDAYAIYDSEFITQHPDWVLRDAAGDPLYIPYGCSGGTCPQYAADFGNPEFRQWWIDDLAATLAEGYLGVFVDDVNMLWRVGDGNGDSVRPVDPRTGTEMTFDDWRRYMAEFMEAIRDAFPDHEIVHNLIWYADSENPYVRRQIQAADFANLERGATDSGIRGGDGKYGYETFLSFIDLVQGWGGAVVLADDDSDTLSEWVYELATYLLIKSGDDMIGADGDRSRMNPDNFWEGYDIAFGEPLGDRYVADGLFRRDYRCGTVVLNQPDQVTRTVDLGETLLLVGGEGARVSSVTLDEYRAAVLLRENCTP